MKNTTPLEFLFEHIGKHIFPNETPGSFLMKPAPYATKKNPEDGLQRIGSCGDVFFLASQENSIIIAPLIGVKDTATFKVIRKALPSQNVVLGNWLWEVKTPFVFAAQGKASVEANLRLSQSLRGSVFSTANSIEAFDLAMCREIATQLIEAGATRKYAEMQAQTHKLAEIPYDKSGMAELIKSVNKKIEKLVKTYPILNEIRLPWPGTMESQVIRWLIDSKEAANA